MEHGIPLHIQFPFLHPAGMLALNPSEVDQLKVYLEAFEIYQDRNTIRGDLWMKADIRDSLQHVRSKLLRAENMAQVRRQDPQRYSQPEMKDSCLDGINFFAFSLQHSRAGRFGGPE
jgi:hypothetical protein